MPQSLQVGSETLQTPETGRDGVVIEPSVEDSPQPSPGFVHASMHPPAEFFLDPSQGTRYAFRAAVSIRSIRIAVTNAEGAHVQPFGRSASPFALQQRSTKISL